MYSRVGVGIDSVVVRVVSVLSVGYNKRIRQIRFIFCKIYPTLLKPNNAYNEVSDVYLVLDIFKIAIHNFCSGDNWCPLR